MELPKRKSIRLKDYDYSHNGAYFITVCTKDRLNLFGGITVEADLVSARMELTKAGQMVEEMFLETVNSFDGIITDKYIVMPNHFHCIIIIKQADTRSAPTKTAADVVQAFKSKTTVEYIRAVKAGVLPPFAKQIWQRNYYEHIVRDEKDYQTKWQYIDENPLRWTEDDCFPART